jgi:hypothetical protein
MRTAAADGARPVNRLWALPPTPELYPNLSPCCPRHDQPGPISGPVVSRHIAASERSLNQPAFVVCRWPSLRQQDRCSQVGSMIGPETTRWRSRSAWVRSSSQQRECSPRSRRVMSRSSPSPLAGDGALVEPVGLRWCFIVWNPLADGLPGRLDGLEGLDVEGWVGWWWDVAARQKE